MNKRSKKSSQLLEIKPQSALLEIKSKAPKEEATPATEAVLTEPVAVALTEPVVVAPARPPKAQPPKVQPPKDIQPELPSETETQSEPEAIEQAPKVEIPPGTMFQAIGVIRGNVTFTTEGEKVLSTIRIGAKEYPLFYAPQKRRSYDALQKEVAATGEANQRLVVYPRFTHFPGRDQQPSVAFQLVGFDKGQVEKGASVGLEDFEFQLCGLWQFIPVCKTPCISIFRNFTKDRLTHLKESEPASKVKFMKAYHLPLFWRDAPVPPFRFNPKAEKDQQGKPVFVQVKAKFQPSRDAFAFDSLLALPLEKAPKFLKVSKDDKALAMAARKEFDKAAGRDMRSPNNKPSNKPTYQPKNDSKPQASGAPKDMPKPKPKPLPQPSQP